MLSYLVNYKDLDFSFFIKHKQNNFPKIKKTVELRDFRCDVMRIISLFS